MLRSLLLRASTSPALAQRLPRYGFVKRAVRRFMPGEDPDDALREAHRLGQRGIPTIVTCLGENVGSQAEARRVVDDYLRLSERIHEAGLDMELSVKPTHLGLDVGAGLVARHLRELAEAAPGVLWVDMEGSATVDATLEAWREARVHRDDLGICLQAYLHRTEADYEALLPLAPHVRLVKGAYMEPPDVALARKREVDEAYRRLASRMLRDRATGRMGRPAVATHDARLVDDAGRVAFELGLPRDRWEVEMLYGIGGSLQERLGRTGVPLRVLISYGAHWFPWYVRRLAERPANVGFVLKQLVVR